VEEEKTIFKKDIDELHVPGQRGVSTNETTDDEIPRKVFLGNDGSEIGSGFSIRMIFARHVGLDAGVAK